MKSGFLIGVGFFSFVVYCLLWALRWWEFVCWYAVATFAPMREGKHWMGALPEGRSLPDPLSSEGAIHLRAVFRDSLLRDMSKRDPVVRRIERPIVRPLQTVLFTAFAACTLFALRPWWLAVIIVLVAWSTPPLYFRTRGWKWLQRACANPPTSGKWASVSKAMRTKNNDTEK